MLNLCETQPFAEFFPMQHAAWRKGERPVGAQPKVHICFLVAAKMAKGIKASGLGYNA